MRLLFRPEARRDATEAQAWYEGKARGLGYEFARALEAALYAAARNPLAYPTIGSDCRRVLLRRFPYSLVFQVAQDEVLVLAVFHHRLKPGRLLRRTRVEDAL